MKYYILIPFSIFLFCSINKEIGKKQKTEVVNDFFQKNPDYMSDGFDFPIGKPNAVGYVNVQGFKSSRGHLGEDWNNAHREDMGDPVFAASNGIVSFAEYAGSGWGNVLIITHKLPNGQLIETLYGHLEKMRAFQGMKVKRGENIGTIGDADGAYWPHLHFEIRNDINLSVGPGYSSNTNGYLDPTKFINQNRKLQK